MYKDAVVKNNLNLSREDPEDQDNPKYLEAEEIADVLRAGHLEVVDYESYAL